MKAPAISRLVVLQNIFDCFQQVTQWPALPENLAKHTHKAESLIELLEVADCGSIGGFDPKNPLITVTGHEVFDRFLCVLRKYKNGPDIKPVCGADVRTLTTYFTRLMVLRDQVYRNR